MKRKTELLDSLEKCSVWHHLYGIKDRKDRIWREKNGLGPPLSRKYENQHFKWAKQIRKVYHIIAIT